MSNYPETSQERVKIDVVPRYLAEQSNPDVAEYVFAYTVEVHNVSSEPVQLLGRHWIITDGHNNIREIEGEGVIGQQPHISPGETYRYSSGAILSTKTGMMEGTYRMRDSSGITFDATIHPFGLIHPESLQ